MLLELDNLEVKYGRRRALEDLTVSIDSKALGLLGPNGAGKSTLIRTVLGLLPPSSGGGRLDGMNIQSEQRRIREHIGYMPEHESYLHGMTVVRFLRYMGEMCGLPRRAAMERAHEVLFYVGLGEVRYREMEGFSYGMLQKVRLAQALIHGPKILILDEPTNGLDPAARREMLTLIRDMVESTDARMIISSHLLKDIEDCCHDVLVLKKGRAVASGSIEEMKHTEQNVFELRIKGNLDSFMAALSEQHCECRLGHNDIIQVTTPNGLASQTIFEIAHQHNVQIRHFYAKKDSLEDIFLKALEENGNSNT